MKIILDTNALLVSLPLKSKYHPIFEYLLNGKFTLLISNDILNEYDEIISKKANSNIATNVLEYLNNSKNVEKTDIFYFWNLITNDPDDNKFCDCYISGNAEYLVSNDKHFNEIKDLDFPRINVIKIDDFLNMLLKM